MLITRTQEHGEDLNALVQHHVMDRPLFAGATILTTLSVMLIISAALLFVLARYAARKRGLVASGILENGFEGIVLFVRDELVRPQMGHHGDKFVPYFCTLFCFILLTNLLGIIPIPHIGGTATGNTGLTAVLAASVLLTGIVFGMKENGVVGFFKAFIPPGLPFILRPILFVLELAGHIIKHIVLAVRLCINMVAGHLVLGAFLTIPIAAKAYLAGIPAVSAGLFMSVLELLVCLIQAFVFTLLSVLFVGGMVHPEH
jgi:F-type H+-transporting ATPase subunit a